MPKQYAQFMYGENRSLSEQLGFFSLTNCDVHTDLGVLSNNLAFETESSTPNEGCISEILSNGDTFFFSTESGKIWKRTAAGVYSLVHTKLISRKSDSYITATKNYLSGKFHFGVTADLNYLSSLFR